MLEVCCEGEVYLTSVRALVVKIGQGSSARNNHSVDLEPCHIGVLPINVEIQVVTNIAFPPPTNLDKYTS